MTEWYGFLSLFLDPKYAAFGLSITFPLNLPTNYSHYQDVIWVQQPNLHMHQHRFSLLFAFLFAFVGAMHGQDTTMSVVNSAMAERVDTTVLPQRIDSTTTAPAAAKKRMLFKQPYPAPRVALLLSGVVPGAGQVYNKRYWKVPIIYGAFVGGFLWYNNNRALYKRLRQEHINRVDGDPLTEPETALTNLNDASIVRYRDQFRGKSEQAGLVIGLTWLLNAAEAYTDAHLKSFDVSDDLSLRLVPSTESGAVGLGLRLQIGRPSVAVRP